MPLDKLGFIIETAQSTDFPAIAALNFTAYQEMAAYVPAWKNESFFHSLVEMRAKQATFFVIREDDRVVASVAYCAPGRSTDPIPVEWASVLLLAVQPEYRGRGYARVLAEECIRLAERDKAATLGLFTSELMVAARRLYEGLGFRVDRELERRHGVRYWVYRRDFSG